jgi:O-antigen/teichoic acid export membrane protein
MYSKSLSFPLLSTLSSLLSEGDRSGTGDIARASLRSSLWFIPFAALIAGSSREIVILIFGKDYLPAGPVLAFLIFAVTGMLIINVCRTILTALGRPGWTFMIAGPMLPAALAGHLLLIPRMGGTGAAVVTAVVSWLGAIASLILVGRVWDVFPPARSVMRVLAGSIIAFWLSAIWPASGFVLILKLLSVAAAVIIFLLVTGELTRRGLNSIRSLIRLH